MLTYKQRKILPILQRFQAAPEALVLTGFRRVGKTTIMRHIYEGLASPNKLFLDLESPVNQKLFEEENYDNIKLSLERLGINFNQQCYIFLDEIQQVKNLTSSVKYLYDHWRVKFYLTGSSSFYLKNRFSESLSGRKFLFVLYPLDFEEFLGFKGQKIDLLADYDLLIGQYEEFLRFGGFPSVVLAESAEQKVQQLDDILGSYFQLDVQALSNFRQNQNLRDLLFLLATRVGNRLDATKLASSLGVSRETIYSYLNFLEQTFLVHFVQVFSASPDVRIRHLPKPYLCDTGLLNRLGQIGLGQVLENKIYNQLLSKTVYRPTTSDLSSKINYYQTDSGHEVDFIADRTVGYEVKLQASDQDVRKLSKIAKKLSLSDWHVISLHKISGKNAKIAYPFSL